MHYTADPGMGLWSSKRSGFAVHDLAMCVCDHMICFFPRVEVLMHREILQTALAV